MKKICFVLSAVLLLTLLLPACKDSLSSDPVVELSQQECTINPGDTYQISYTVSPEGTPVEFISSDSKIASVDNNGLITALEPGNISIAVSAGEYSRAYMDVTVTIASATAIPTVQISHTKLELIEGAEFSLTATVKEGTAELDAPVVWTSSDETVVVVSDGKVSAGKCGEAVITATADVNGQMLSASCPISVYTYYEITLDKQSVQAPLGGVIKLNATVRDDQGNTVTPQAGDLELISSDPTAIVVENDTFKVISISDRIPSVGVRYKGNVATIPVDIFSVTADFFTDSTYDFYGEVGDVQFSGVQFLSTVYQPYIYFTQEGIEKLQAYAKENGYSTLRISAYAILYNNSFVLNNEKWIGAQWTSHDIPISKLSTSYFLWSQSEGATEVYMRFELY